MNNVLISSPSVSIRVNPRFKNQTQPANAGLGRPRAPTQILETKPQFRGYSLHAASLAN
jgi:hypothetical protein